ncbi:CmcI family methyltransferase [Paludibaculum fermentans]|uniref:Class I SAM-dependent methyltransferase n=1 Tax=Paludibaculum fermentans TaxID=1473598 RepID=A0A7S7NXZ6_PALFE|nr:CmcI family methyltransferase [Paludibaculum fermentans]QOY91826.1 class I SAM-dependent methyltransferase [Paludibaculum fermentans]
MLITIDTEAAVLTVTEGGHQATHPLYSPDAFHLLSREWLKLGWNLGHWTTFSWMGRQFLQLPDDMLRLAEAIWRLRPAVIVETGIYDGGSTLWFASLCRLMGHGRVISVESEIRPPVRQAIEEHAAGLVTLVEGDSSAPATAAAVRSLVPPGETAFVFLDSDHRKQHVAAELRNFAPLVTGGSYVVVADSNMPELAHLPDGDKSWEFDNPGAAVADFLVDHPEFQRERFVPAFGEPVDFSGLSYFGNTWLRRAAEA